MNVTALFFCFFAFALIPRPANPLYTPMTWCFTYSRIRAKEEGLLEKPLPSESRKLRRKVAENLVKKGYSEESIGVNKVSGTKQERGN